MGKHAKKQYYDEAGNLVLKPYRLVDLSQIFDVNVLTLKKWIAQYPQELGEKNGKYYSVNQVRFMAEKFGLPQKIPVQMFPGMQNAA
jgi:hypothetical protein